MLSCRDLHVAYGRTPVLDGVSVTLGDGGAVALLGRNGAGKTTTLKAIMGLVRVRAGTLAIDGADVTNQRPDRIARRGLGYVPEDRRVFPELTVAENLDAAAQPERPDAPAWDREAVLSLFPNLDSAARTPAARLSGGEQQMLALGRALMTQPRLLVLDEPAEGLAPRVLAQIRDTLARLRASGLAVLLAEQNVRFAAAVADDAVVLHRGAVHARLDMAELAADEALRRRYLGV